MSAPVRLPVLADTEAPARPVTRGDCAGGPRPCPWVSCSHHAIHGVLIGESGRDLSDDQAIEAIEAMPASCTLDVADEGGAVEDGYAGTLRGIGDLWGVSHERVRQIEARAMKRLGLSAMHLRAECAEEPSPELRPTAGGAAQPVEERRPLDAPAQHAHLPTPATVRESAEAMWCPWIGAAMTGALCARRHTARREKSANAGAGPVYPSCASCADGAALTARVGRLGELVPLRVAVPAARIDWMGEGDDPAETDTAPRRNGRRGGDVKVQRREDAGAVAPAKTSSPTGVIAPAPGRACIVPGCSEPPQGYRETLDTALRAMCRTHRHAVQKLRTPSHGGLTTDEAVARVVARAQSGAFAPATAREAVRDLHAATGGEFAALREERDRGAVDRIEELEGQLLADATHRAPAPLARLAALFGAIDPHSRGASVSVVLGAEGSRAELRDLECLGSGEVVHHADGDTPDEALAALVAVVEGVARVRVEALTAALEGRR